MGVKANAKVDTKVDAKVNAEKADNKTTLHAVKQV